MIHPQEEQIAERQSFSSWALSEKIRVANRGFYAFYVGDFDSAAWAYQQLYLLWDDKARGTVPLGWALNPNLSIRFPLIFDMMYEGLTPQDRVTTGDSGGGYLNPTELFGPRSSGLPDGRQVWKAWCMPLYQKFGTTFTGFLLNGSAGNMTHECQAFYAEYRMTVSQIITGAALATLLCPLLKGTPLFSK